MQNCTTILGVIDMRQRGISFDDCRNHVCCIKKNQKDFFMQQTCLTFAMAGKAPAISRFTQFFHAIHKHMKTMRFVFIDRHMFSDSFGAVYLG